MSQPLYHDTLSQIEGIHSMLASGHRSIRLEKHTLVLWGITAALLILGLDLIINPETFPVKWQRSTVKLLIIAVILLMVGMLDVRLTKRVRSQREESLSFVQKQIMKVWWLLAGLIVVLDMGMDFFGGHYMFYGAVLMLVGMGFYTFGLFSTRILSWSGVLLIGLGLASLVMHPPFYLLKDLAASVCGIGLPLLALLLQREQWHATLSRCVMAMFAWLLACLAPVGMAYGMHAQQDTIPATALTLEQYQHMADVADPVTVALPPGTVIPLTIEVEGEVFNTAAPVMVPVTLAKTLYISVVDKPKSEGQPQFSKKWHVLNQSIKTTRTKAHSFIDEERRPEARVALKIELFKNE